MRFLLIINCIIICESIKLMYFKLDWNMSYDSVYTIYPLLFHQILIKLRRFIENGRLFIGNINRFVGGALPQRFIIIIMPHTYKSSFRFTTLSPITKQDLRKAKHIISHIIDNPESAEFREPVNWEGLGLLDYLTLVPNPMDLGTVLRKINEEQYEHLEEFLDDTELIWDNCKTYNLKGSWIYQLADKLEKNCKKMLKNYFPGIPLQNVKKEGSQTVIPQIKAESDAMAVESKGVSADPPKVIKQKKSQKPDKEKHVEREKVDKLYYQDEEEITFAQKMKLADKFKALSEQQNAEIVNYIQAVCPTAFREQQQRVQVLVDNLDVITFKQLIEKIEDVESRDPASSKKIKTEN